MLDLVRIPVIDCASAGMAHEATFLERAIRVWLTMYIGPLLGNLADQVVQAGGPGLSRAAFISGALRELSVALCRGNASLCRSGAYVAPRAAGRAPMRGLVQPSAKVV
jgi:hypothetical protein